MYRHKVLAASSVLVLNAVFGSGTVTAAQPSVSESGEGTISRDRAQAIALERLPGGTIKESELEKEGGKLVWSFDVAMPATGKVMDVEIDAKTGEVLKVEEDD